MKCPKCGQNVENGERYCRSCGSPVQEEINTWNNKCPNCGAETTSTMKFCRNCGHALSENPVFQRYRKIDTAVKEKRCGRLALAVTGMLTAICVIGYVAFRMFHVEYIPCEIVDVLHGTWEDSEGSLMMIDETIHFVEGDVIVLDCGVSSFERVELNEMNAPKLYSNDQLAKFPIEEYDFYRANVSNKGEIHEWNFYCHKDGGWQLCIEDLVDGTDAVYYKESDQLEWPEAENNADQESEEREGSVIADVTNEPEKQVALSSENRADADLYPRPERILEYISGEPKQGDDIKYIQAALIEMNYSQLEVNGIYDTNTRDAVKRFQKNHKKTQNGIVDTAMVELISEALEDWRIRQSNVPELTEEYGSDPDLYPIPVRSLYYRADDLLIGDDVKYVQAALIEMNYDGVLVTGTFNQATEDAVIRFQKNHSLLADGIVGDKTIAKIQESLDTWREKH